MRDRQLIEKLHQDFCGTMEQFRYNKYILEVLLDIRELLVKEKITIKLDSPKNNAEKI